MRLGMGEAILDPGVVIAAVAEYAIISPTQAASLRSDQACRPRPHWATI